jgi:triosephosphate isomerase
MNRTKIIAGNWKMNFGPQDAVKYFAGLKAASAKAGGSNAAVNANVKRVIFPVAYALGSEVQNAARECGFDIGAQNIHWEEKGAFTGELSGAILKSIGISWVLIGHSERRQYFGETDETAARRFQRAAALGLNIIYCIGEKLEERESGKTEAVLSRQLTALAGVLKDTNQAPGVVWSIAYEPVWAIGTGKTATTEQAESAHRFIRATIAALTSRKYENVPILYGGSVTPDNARELLAQADVDGVLVGGASLKPEGFAQILNGL